MPDVHGFRHIWRREIHGYRLTLIMRWFWILFWPGHVFVDGLAEQKAICQRNIDENGGERSLLDDVRVHGPEGSDDFVSQLLRRTRIAELSRLDELGDTHDVVDLVVAELRVGSAHERGFCDNVSVSLRRK